MSAQKAARLPLLPVAALTLLAVISAQQNQGVRIADNPYGNHIGRVEVNYYGRWGTICENGWSSYDADVICGMLNYTGYICAINSATSTFGEGTGSVWLNNLACRYYDTTLDRCRNSNPYNINPCTHSRDAALICQDPTVMPVPFEMTVLSETTRSITVGWQLEFIPPLIQAIDFRLNVTAEDATFARIYVTRVPVTDTSMDFNYTIPRLSFNTSYTLYIRADGEYQWCPYNELLGEYSDPVVIATADMIPPSTLPMRLLSQNPLTEPYIGRLQVYHDGQWGNVCDDYFRAVDADVACLSLNYTDGAICYANRPFPPSSAPILLDNIDCSNADRFEDCIHRGWGVHDCSLSESIGLICNPGTSVAPLVTGLRITAVAPYSITVAWDPLRDVRRYRVMYGAVGGRTQLTYVRSSTSEWTLSRLVLNQNYTINISAAITFSRYRGGNCYSYFYGEPSDSVYALTKESPPTIAISAFHVTVVNSTVVEVTWQPPSTTVGINGDLRGFKLFVDKIDGNQTIIDISGALNRAYIVTNLEELATYLFSILMYTVGDGPMSVRLQVTMPNASYVQLFQVFGRWGDGIEVLRAYAYSTGYNVLCGSNTLNAAYEWRFANGSRIGISNSGFRAAHFVNGTAVLQIGTASVYRRRLNACDGGVYTCIGTYPDGSRLSRNFTLIYGSSQPSMGAPRLNQRSSRWVQIGWDPLDCDGGFPLSAYVVEYRRSAYYSSYTTLGEVTRLNYTIRELSPLSSYNFRIGRKSSSSLSISYSSSLSVTTLESGPSEPRSVVVRVGFNSEVCATWVQPALPVGTIILYNLYAEVVENSVEAVDVVDLPSNTAFKSFPGSQRSGCMRLSVTGVIYHFQMSAVVIINGRRVEGTLSPYSQQTTLFVPEPGLPQPVNVRASSTNTSVTLQWELPEDLQLDEKTFYNVSYSGLVEWISPSGVFTSFREQGWKTTDNTTIIFSPLTPSTAYVFRVSVVTEDGQSGTEVTSTVTTSSETGGKLAYFQVRIQTSNANCEQWVAEDTEGKLSQIQKSLQQSMLLLCQCQPQLSQGEFSCRTGPPNTVTYRARITGTSSRSATEVVAIMGAWVQTNKGSVQIDRLRYYLDPTCDPTLENIHGPDCQVAQTPTDGTTVTTGGSTVTTDNTTTHETTNKPVTSDTSKPSTEDSTTPPITPPTKPGIDPKDPQSERQTGDDNGGAGATTGQVAGILIGGVIAGLLATLIIIIVFFLCWKYRKQSYKSQSEFNELVNEPGRSRNSAVMAEDDKL